MLTHRTFAFTIALLGTIAPYTCPQVSAQQLPPWARYYPPQIQQQLQQRQAAWMGCHDPRLRSVGAMQWLSAAAGRKSVVRVDNPTDDPGWSANGATTISCHAVLLFADGERQSGVFSFSDPGGSAPPIVTWRTDAQIAAAAAERRARERSARIFARAYAASPEGQAEHRCEAWIAAHPYSSHVATPAELDEHYRLCGNGSYIVVIDPYLYIFSQPPEHANPAISFEQGQAYGESRMR